MREDKIFYVYTLTESNRFLIDIIEGITIDEYNQVLWSEQDLDSLNLEHIYVHYPIVKHSPRVQEETTKLKWIKNFLKQNEIIIILLIVLGILSVEHLFLKTLQIIPNKKLQKWRQEKIDKLLDNPLEVLGQFTH